MFFARKYIKFYVPVISSYMFFGQIVYKVYKVYTRCIKCINVYTVRCIQGVLYLPPVPPDGNIYNGGEDNAAEGVDCPFAD